MRIASIACAAAVAAVAVAGLSAQVNKSKLTNPLALVEQAPPTFKVNLDTSKGAIVIEVHRDWAPNGADRFYNLVKSGYLDDVRFYRVVQNFMAQFGIHGDPAVNQAWARAQFPDDKTKESNLRGYVTFARTGAPNSRNTQLFINFKDNTFLDNQGFAPIGKVVTGMNVADKLYSYGDIAEQPQGTGPSQAKTTSDGNAYLTKSFPKMDYIKKATIVQ